MSKPKVNNIYIVTCDDESPEEYSNLQIALEAAVDMARNNPDLDIHICETIKVCKVETVKPIPPPIVWLKE